MIYHCLLGYSLKWLATRVAKSRAFSDRESKSPTETQQSCALQDGLARCSPLEARSVLPARHCLQRMLLSKSQGSGRISLLIKCLAFSARYSPKYTSCNYTGSPVQLTSFNRHRKFKKTFNIIMGMNLVGHRFEITLHES